MIFAKVKIHLAAVSTPMTHTHLYRNYFTPAERRVQPFMVQNQTTIDRPSRN